MAKCYFVALIDVANRWMYLFNEVLIFIGNDEICFSHKIISLKFPRPK